MEVKVIPRISGIHRLRRIIEVQEEYKKHKEEGITDKRIYKKHIYPKFFISESTFKKYMYTNARRELKIIEDYLATQQTTD